MLQEIPQAHGSKHPHSRRTSPLSAESLEALRPWLAPAASPPPAAAWALPACVFSTPLWAVSLERVWVSAAMAWMPASPDRQPSAASDTQIPRRDLTLDKTTSGSPPLHLWFSRKTSLPFSRSAANGISVLP